MLQDLYQLGLPRYVVYSESYEHLCTMKVADIPTYTSNCTLSDSDRSAARVAVLFPGGLDCTLLARLTNDLLPLEESIDLPNVAFYKPRAVSANPSQALRPYESCPDRTP